MPHTLVGSDCLYRHPEHRAADLMQAFWDPSIKGILSCMGGDESVRLLPYVDFAVISHNPKVLLGYSDTTIAHLMCAKAGLSSFYGPSILAELAENVQVFDFTLSFIKKALFRDAPIGPLPCSPTWTGERIEWGERNSPLRKTLLPNAPYKVLQSRGTVTGRLWGGCMEVLEMAKGTTLWPSPQDLEGAILFFNLGGHARPKACALLAAQLWGRRHPAKSRSLVFAKPYQETFEEEYHAAITKALAELGLQDLPVVCNAPIGHNEPMLTLLYGALASLDCEAADFCLLERGVC